MQVAVVDVGFKNLADAKAKGYLPGDAVLVDYCSSGTNGTTHGTAVASIVHAAAPDADLHLICVDSEVGLAQAEQYAEDNGIRVVNHSVSWFNTSRGDGTGDGGSPDAIVARAADAGILWVNSAGNYGRVHWGGPYADSNGNGWHQFSGSSEIAYFWSSGSVVCASLKWDEWDGAETDLDVYLVDNNTGGIVAGSTNEQSGTQPPVEDFCFDTEPSRYYFFVIDRFAGDAEPRLDLFAHGVGDLTPHVRATSITEPASSPDALAVTAACGPRADAYHPSEGPTIDGRTKPDVGAPDRVHAYDRGLTSSSCESSGFLGTSAAAPHVAGAAALVLGHTPGLTGAEVRQLLEASVFDVFPTLPPTNSYGHGLLRLPPTAPVFHPGRSGSRAGEGAVVYGAFFDRVTALSIGGVPATLLANQGIEDFAQFTIPDAAVSGPVTVTTPEGTTVSAEPFNVSARLDSHTPSFGCEGTEVTLKGGGLKNLTAVRVGTTPAASFEIVSGTEAKFVVAPAGSGGDIVVTTVGGETTTGGSFTLGTSASRTQITSFAPAVATIGTEVTVTGTGLGCIAQIMLGDTQIVDYTTFVNSGWTKLTFRVGSAFASAPIRIATTLGRIALSKKQLAMAGPPSIKSFAPRAQFVGGVVTLKGSGFTGASSVKVGGVAAAYRVDADGSLTVTIPNGAANGKIAVVTPVGATQSAADFTVAPPPAPSVKSFTPKGGAVGATVTIAGKGLTRASAVRFNGTPATAFTVVDDAKITATVPAGATSGPVSVTTPGGTATTKQSFAVG